MDNTMMKSSAVKYPAIVMMCIIISAALFTVCGAKLALITQTDISSFYGRYDGVGKSFFAHVAAAVAQSVPFLMQALSLYLFSYSPLIIPAGLCVVGFRGVAAGFAYNRICSTDDATQLSVYVIITAAICVLTLFFALCRKYSYGISGVFKRTRALLVTAGTTVILEIMLSYII